MTADTAFGTDRADSGRAGTSFDKPPAWGHRGRAFANGYIQAMIEAVAKQA